ncbi:MAG TPA: type II/IV secretion system ATPase subunit [Candidatus Thermoplasmatota archaeon]|nr:type II/IV secretion system ATPase subunit [Candidatus Thermoplasmatota archaeon]
MDTQVRFPKFIATLKELGAPVGGAAFLADASGTWSALPFETRAACLNALEVPLEPLTVTIRLGKVPDAPKSLDAVLVIFEGEARAATPAPDATPVAAPTPAEEELHELLADAPAAEPAPAAPLAAAEEPRPKKGKKGKKSEPQPSPAAAPAAPAPVTQPLMVLPEEPAGQAPPPEPKAKGRGLFGKFAKKEKQEEAPAKPPKPTAVTEIPPLTDPNLEAVEVYAVQEPYAYVRILHDKARQENIYEVIEPALSERERNILDFIEHTIVDVIEVGLSALNKEQAAELLYKHVDEVIYDYSIVLNPVSREKILYYILRDFLGFGKLDPMMRDEYIEDISCDGPNVPIFLYHRRHESIKSNTTFVKDDELDSFVIKMAQRSGKHVSIAEPLLDATLPDGSRLNATLSDEVTDGGSTFTIRKFKEDPFTIPDLVRFGTMNVDLLAYWWLAVQNGASAIYAGGTASGKTTSLNAILLFIPPQMKIVSIEDTREINLPHENWIAGVTRSGFGPRDNNGRQAGEIDMFTLLKAALRQRPEYILVGEVRGQEATALFQAMATGHTAYGTMHADSTEAVIHRLESDPISIPRSLLEALDIVSIQIQTRIGDRRVRRTKELVEIVGLDPHTREILTNQVFTWSPATDEFEFSGVSYVLERIQIERNMNESDMKEEFERRKRIIRWMVDNNIRALDDVGRIIATYYRNPAAVMAMIDQQPAGGAEAMKALVPVEEPAHAPATLELVPVAEEAQHGPQ